MIFQVFTVVSVCLVIFWVMILCSIVSGYLCLEEYGTSIIRVIVRGVGIQSGYISRLQGWWSLRSLGGGEEIEPGLGQYEW
jgi:hypothetical protein